MFHTLQYTDNLHEIHQQDDHHHHYHRQTIFHSAIFIAMCQ